MSGEEQLEHLFTEMPLPPTAGQILGFVIKHLDGLRPPFDGRQHRRFFSGSEDYKVPLETKEEIISDVAEWIMEIGLFPRNQSVPDDHVFRGILFFLHTQISEWEWWRNHLFDNRVFVPTDVINATWSAYLRVATIELAIRIASGMVLSGRPRDRANLIQYVADAQPGVFLKDIQKDAGLTRDQLSSEMDRPETTVDNWLDKDARPRNDALHELAKVFAAHLDGAHASEIEGDLRRLYLLDDIAELLSGFVGSDSVSQCLERLRKYVGHSYDYLIGSVLKGQDPDAIASILLYGTSSSASQQVLEALARTENSDVWSRELESANLPWQMRVTLDTVEAMTSDYEQNRWLLGDHAKETFGSHFNQYGDEVRQAMDQAMILLQEGKLLESDAVFANITELNPLDASLHEFVGISRKDTGHRLGNKKMLQQALDSLWRAATLDKSSLRPWISIGHTLCILERAQEAISHLQSLSPERGNPDVEYYIVLSIAYKLKGNLTESLRSLESAMKLDPSDPEPPHLAAQIAALAGNKSVTKRYAREARRLGMPEAELAMLVGMAEWVSTHGRPDSKRPRNSR